MFEVSKKIITEISKRRKIIRDLVSDVINIYKSEEEGEFYLPEDVDGKHVYEFPKLQTPIRIELTIFPDDEVDNFIIDADFFYKEGVIAITIVYDPEKKIKLIYDIIGELNEVIAHEIRHVDQHRLELYDFNDEEEETDPIKYYTQPHELDAQVYGFNRISKLKKIPFKDVVKTWFETHKDIHGMEKQDYEKVIQKIIDEKNK
jgi:hypothetical protein